MPLSIQDYLPCLVEADSSTMVCMLDAKAMLQYSYAGDVFDNQGVPIALNHPHCSTYQ